VESRYGLRCMNVFHAGDGNLHPLILFDANDQDSWERTERFGTEILELCVELGGTITGEHGVGLEKLNPMCVQFSPAERAAFAAVKEAFDPKGLLNPGKDRKSTRLNSSHTVISYAVFCLKKKKKQHKENSCKNNKTLNHNTDPNTSGEIAEDCESKHLLIAQGRPDDDKSTTRTSDNYETL